MGFVIAVAGDALEAMQDAWDDVTTFTRSELGGAPDWAAYVDADGELYSESELEDAYEDWLTDCYGSISVCGYEYDAGSVFRELDPTAFRCGFLDWIDVRVCDGDLRSIEGC